MPPRPERRADAFAAVVRAAVFLVTFRPAEEFWTRAFAVVSYEQAVRPFLETGRLSDSERAILMGGACAKAYGWAPSQASRRE